MEKHANRFARVCVRKVNNECLRGNFEWGVWILRCLNAVLVL